MLTYLNLCSGIGGLDLTERDGTCGLTGCKWDRSHENHADENNSKDPWQALELK